MRRAGALLAALERGREPVMADLPLFAALPVEPPTCVVCEALDEVDAEALSGREALALIYRLKELTAKEEKTSF